MGISISAIVCTLNRAEYLRKALKSLVDQTLAKEKYEIIVVDNGSSDNTKEVVRCEFGDVSSLRYLYEPVLGLSRARNTGWRNAKGEYVAYLDDDAIADSYWLEKIVDVFQTVKPTPGCVGGRVQPIWEAPRPPWLPDQILPCLTILDWSKTPISLNDQQYLAGASIAFPRRLLESMGGFDLSLGRKGSKLLSNEDLQLRERLKKEGYSCFYDPHIAIRHHVPASRLTKGFFLWRMYWQGASNAILKIQQDNSSIASRGLIAALAVGKMLVSPRILANLVLPADNPVCFARKCSAFSRVGYILGILGVAK